MLSQLVPSAFDSIGMPDDIDAAERSHFVTKLLEPGIIRQVGV